MRTREGLARRGKIHGDLEVLYALAILRSGEEMNWRWTCGSRAHTWDFHVIPRTASSERQDKAFQQWALVLQENIFNYCISGSFMLYYKFLFNIWPDLKYFSLPLWNFSSV